jgi:hypothetical protein
MTMLEPNEDELPVRILEGLKMEFWKEIEKT